MIGIYKITSPSGRIYIGQTVNWITRKRQYLGCKVPNQRLIFNSLKKYGARNHKFDFILRCEEQDLDRIEQFFISYFNSTDKKIGMNLVSGGNSNKRYSEESKKLMSQSLKGKQAGSKNPNYGKTGILSHNYGIVRSDKTRGKMSLAQKGRSFSVETIARMSASAELRRASDETKAKMSRQRKGKKRPNHSKAMEGNKNPMFGSCRLNHMGKKVMCTITGVVYLSAREAAEKLRIPATTLRSRLNGSLKNTTSFRYV